jgi:hypothetical protein
VLKLFDQHTILFFYNIDDMQYFKVLLNQTIIITRNLYMAKKKRIHTHTHLPNHRKKRMGDGRAAVLIQGQDPGLGQVPWVHQEAVGQLPS